jgi:hypothetical protein
LNGNGTRSSANCSAGDQMPERILSLRELNRATLARQMLLERRTLPVSAAIEHLVGLQAQLPVAPYVGLWTRLVDFQREDLASLIDKHEVVKATMMRATLHLVTADDYLRLRPTLKPMLERAGSAIAKRRGGEVELERILEAARRHIAEKPRTFAELSHLLAEAMPGADVGAMRYSVRMHLPPVQVPIPTGWSYPNKPAFTLAETWIGRPISAQIDLKHLVYKKQSWRGNAAPCLTRA